MLLSEVCPSHRPAGEPSPGRSASSPKSNCCFDTNAPGAGFTAKVFGNSPGRELRRCGRARPMTAMLRNPRRPSAAPRERRTPACRSALRSTLGMRTGLALGAAQVGYRTRTGDLVIIGVLGDRSRCGRPAGVLSRDVRTDRHRCGRRSGSVPPSGCTPRNSPRRDTRLHTHGNLDRARPHEFAFAFTGRVFVALGGVRRA